MFARGPVYRKALLRTLGGALLLLPALSGPAPAQQSYGTAPTQQTISGKQRITGNGAQISITEAPWQVRLLTKSDGICGGVILDSQHVVTAAHCTYSGTTPLTTSEIVVFSGSSAFSSSSPYLPSGPTPPDDPVSSTVSQVRRHPGYVPSADGSTDAQHGRDDVAVLTLSAPLILDGLVRRAVELPVRNSQPTVGSLLSVTGFGIQDELTRLIDGKLRRLNDMTVLDPVIWVGEWNAVYVTATSASGLVCSGDSGGPLVQPAGTTATLIGLVSFTPDCLAGTTSVYTRIAPGEIRDFILGDDDPPPAPAGGGDVLLTVDNGGALPLLPGRVLGCWPGTWSSGPALTVAFIDGTGKVLQDGPSTSYTISQGDVGRRIACRSRAESDGGVAYSPITAAPPAVEQPPVATPAAKQAGSLTLQLRTRRRTVKRRTSIGVTITATAKTAAVKNARACVTSPRHWKVMSRGKAKLTGRTLCLTTGSLAAGRSLTATFSLRPGPSSQKGKTTLRLRQANTKVTNSVAKSLYVR